MNDLTARQSEVFVYLVEYFWDNHQIPPMTKISEHFGFASANAAQEHVNHLYEKGYLQVNENGKYKFTHLDLLISEAKNAPVSEG